MGKRRSIYDEHRGISGQTDRTDSIQERQRGNTQGSGGPGAVVIPAAGIWWGLHYGPAYLAERLELSALITMGPVENIPYLTELQRKILENSRWIGSAYGQPQEWMSGVSNYTLTYGGNGMLATFMLCGLMLSIYRYEDVYPEESSSGRVKIYN